MNFADPLYWAQETNLAELQQDQAQRDKVEIEEKARITGYLRAYKNWLYVDAIRFKDNARILKSLVAEVDKYAQRIDLHPHDVQLVPNPMWTDSGRLLLQMRPHPDIQMEADYENRQ